MSGWPAGALGRDDLAAGGADERGAAREHVGERARVEMVEVRVARGDDVDEGEAGRLDDEPGDALVQHARLVARLAQRVREVRVEQDVLLRHLHQEAALPEPPDVHAAIVGRGPDLGDEILAGEHRVDPVGWLLVEGVARRPRHGPPERLGMSGRSGSASAALRLNAESSPRRVVGPDGKSASGSLAMVVRGRGRWFEGARRSVPAQRS